MTQTVTTNSGLVFSTATDGTKTWFILTCPICGERLQLTDAMLDGKEPVTHEDANYRGAFCNFGGIKTLGAELVPAMQANLLMSNRSPFDGEVKP